MSSITLQICVILLNTFTISNKCFFEKNGGNDDYMKYLLYICIVLSNLFTI